MRLPAPSRMTHGFPPTFAGAFETKCGSLWLAYGAAARSRECLAEHRLVEGNRRLILAAQTGNWGRRPPETVRRRRFWRPRPIETGAKFDGEGCLPAGILSLGRYSRRGPRSTPTSGLPRALFTLRQSSCLRIAATVSKAVTRRTAWPRERDRGYTMLTLYQAARLTGRGKVLEEVRTSRDDWKAQAERLTFALAAPHASPEPAATRVTSASTSEPEIGHARGAARRVSLGREATATLEEGRVKRLLAWLFRRRPRRPHPPLAVPEPPVEFDGGAGADPRVQRELALRRRP